MSRWVSLKSYRSQGFIAVRKRNGRPEEGENLNDGRKQEGFHGFCLNV